MPRQFTLTLLVVLSAVTQAPTFAKAPAALAAAHEAWDRGDYAVALKAYIEIVDGANGAAALEEIALQTGELYRTRELGWGGRY